MALLVEDGTIVDGANSYASESDLTTFASARGVDLSTLTAEQREVLLVKAMDYLESLRNRFQGCKVTETQDLQWPRTDVWLDGYELGSTTIPRELFYAQMQLAIDANSTDLQPTLLPTQTGAVIEETVDVLTVKYDNPASRRSSPAFAKAEALLAPLLTRNGLVALRA